jgi:hypothetical protein
MDNGQNAATNAKCNLRKKRGMGKTSGKSWVEAVPRIPSPKKRNKRRVGIRHQPSEPMMPSPPHRYSVRHHSTQDLKNKKAVVSYSSFAPWRKKRGLLFKKEDYYYRFGERGLLLLV